MDVRESSVRGERIDAPLRDVSSCSSLLVNGEGCLQWSAPTDDRDVAYG